MHLFAVVPVCSICGPVDMEGQTQKTLGLGFVLSWSRPNLEDEAEWNV